jgi:hypothetical protein
MEGNQALSQSTTFSELLGTASPPPAALSEASQAPALTIEHIGPDHDSPLPKETTQQLQPEPMTLQSWAKVGMVSPIF